MLRCAIPATPILAITLLLAGCDQTPPPPPNAVPPEVIQAFDNVSSYELFSLDPEAKPTGRQTMIHGVTCLGSVDVTEAAARKSMTELFQLSVRERDGAQSAAPFEPHHMLRVKGPDSTMDLMISFKGGDVVAWQGNTKLGTFHISRTPRLLFNRMYQDSMVPTALHDD